MIFFSCIRKFLTSRIRGVLLDLVYDIDRKLLLDVYIEFFDFSSNFPREQSSFYTAYVYCSHTLYKYTYIYICVYVYNLHNYKLPTNTVLIVKILFIQNMNIINHFQLIADVKTYKFIEKKLIKHNKYVIVLNKRQQKLCNINL